MVARAAAVATTVCALAHRPPRVRPDRPASLGARAASASLGYLVRRDGSPVPPAAPYAYSSYRAALESAAAGVPSCLWCRLYFYLTWTEADVGVASADGPAP